MQSSRTQGPQAVRKSTSTATVSSYCSSIIPPSSTPSLHMQPSYSQLPPQLQQRPQHAQQAHHRSSGRSISQQQQQQQQQRQQSALYPPGYCKHSFKIIDSETPDLLWDCEDCSSGPHWFIFECKHCQFKCCRVCCYTA